MSAPKDTRRYPCPWCGRAVPLTLAGRYRSHRAGSETCEGTGMVPGRHVTPVPPKEGTR